MILRIMKKGNQEIEAKFIYLTILNNKTLGMKKISTFYAIKPFSSFSSDTSGASKILQYIKSKNKKSIFTHINGVGYSFFYYTINDKEKKDIYKLAKGTAVGERYEIDIPTPKFIKSRQKIFNVISDCEKFVNSNKKLIIRTSERGGKFFAFWKNNGCQFYTDNYSIGRMLGML